MLNKKFLLVAKPSGPTSHDVIDRLRRITGIKKIGHAGTLDPFAGGLLLVAVGRESTRELANFVGLDKEYWAILRLGAVSDTQDRTGKITVLKNEFKNLNQEKIKEILQKFVGEQEQMPPMFSAKKVQGKKLYELARRGIEISRPPHKIKIFSLEFLSFQNQFLEIKVHCSSGTYVRTLAHDLGQAIGGGAYLQQLKRLKIGKYKLADAVKLDDLNKDNWQDFCWQ